MEENFRIQDNLLWISMPKEMDHHMAEYIREIADRKILNEQVENVVFDFAKTEFMDSSGIGVIAGRYKKVASFGGKVIVLHANKRMQKIILLSGLSEFVEIID